MNLEQELKEYLDGKFFWLNHDGKLNCRTVSRDFSPAVEPLKYKKSTAAKGGHKSASKRPNYFLWPKEEAAWLQANFKTKTITECAAELKISYHRVYAKVTAFRWADWQAGQ